MSALTMEHFDTLEFVKKSKELATKKDLESTKNQIIMWISGVVITSGIITHFIK